jgi:putative nucleotidyltransferase with HDIG domain
MPADALRRLAVLRHHQGASADARDLCRRSYDVARRAGDAVLAGEALNTLGGIDLETDAVADARRNFLAALKLGGQNRALCARVEQNLGILANIQGDFDEAIARYERSLEAYRAADDEHGCALAYHNLGMASTSGGRCAAAARYFQQSLEIAQRTGDAHLKGLCLVNHAKVLIAQGRPDEACDNAQAALSVFDQLGVERAKAGAYLVLGSVNRDAGRFALAESQFQAAIELAVRSGSVLNEADASREMALLFQAIGRNQDALRLLHAAHRLFGRLDARRDLVHVDSKVAELEAAYRAVVREWGQSIESSDTYTFGHCARVAQYSGAVARVFGMDEEAQTAVRLGAYLHDLGKVRVPLEILRKPGPLSPEEFAVLQRHTIWGIELLAGVEFPWDLKPIIRWHHERYDGTGYPDGLRGDEIPLAAQIVGIADVYDALTTERPYSPALSRAQALATITASKAGWSDTVYDAFVAALGSAAVLSLTDRTKTPRSRRRQLRVDSSANVQRALRHAAAGAPAATS